MIGTLLERLLVAVGVDLTDLKGELATASREVDRATSRMERDFVAMGASWQRVGQGMQRAGLVMTAAITAPLAIFGQHAARAAIDAEEMNSAFNVVFGDMSASMRQWAVVTGDAMGRSTQELQAGAMAFQELFSKALDPAEAAQMSREFAVLVQDLASFKNLSNEVAQQKLFSGLTGETEPLRAVGVFLNEAAVQARALELGLAGTASALTDQDKIIARASLIREQLAAADGDVMRTSESTANRIRAAQSAYQELSVTVGTTLIPALTPLIGAIASVLESFNTLPAGVQTTIVSVAALAAALGPVITVAGTLVSGMGSLIALLGGGAGAAGVAGAAGAAGGAFAGLGAAIAPALPIIAAVAAAGALVYAYWDKIAPVLEEFGATVQRVLGPPIRELVTSATQLFSEFWNGPLGAKLREAMGYLVDFQLAYSSVFGTALIYILRAVIQTVTMVFNQIADAIRLVNALMTGDWAGAWNAAAAIVNRALLGIPTYAAQMVGALRRWLVDALADVWQNVLAKIELVRAAFFNLYDAVVGHSYIPDMVDGIGRNMARLRELMVDPATAATAATGEAFRELAGEVSNVLDRLFPVQARIRGIMEDMATLKRGRAAGQIDQATYDQARAALERERASVRREQSGIGSMPLNIPVPDMRAAVAALGDLSAVMRELPQVGSEAAAILREFGQTLGDEIMGGLRDVLSGRLSLRDWLAGMFSDFLYSAVTNAMQSLETTVFGKQGLGGFLSNLFGSIAGRAVGGPVIPTRAHTVGNNNIAGRAVGGPVIPTRAYTVGNGELFVPSKNGRILSRTDAMAAVGGGGGGIGSIHVTVTGARGNQEIMEMVRTGVAQGIAGYDAVSGARVDENFRRRG